MMRGSMFWMPRLPALTPQTSNAIEMAVAAHHGHCVLTAERSDPNVVGGYRRAGCPQLQPDGRVMPGGLHVNIKDDASVQHSLQGSFVRLSMPRLGDTERELPGDDNRNRNLARLKDNFNRGRRSVQIGGKSVRVQNQIRSSGSICSNSSSISF